MYRNPFTSILIALTLIICMYMVGCDAGTDSTSDGADDVCCNFGNNGSGESNWSFSDDTASLGISGVSPEAILLDDGSVRLYVTDIGGMRVYKAGDGLTFTEETSLTPAGGSDPTLIKLDNGTYRMYYVDHEQPGGVIWTATSPDGLGWTRESNTGIGNDTGGPAWGVPDSVELPNGRIRLYWVDQPQGTICEVIKSALSSDGVVFDEETGYRTEGGYVDSYVLLAEDGNWIGLFATTPLCAPQKIYVGTSTDGLTWSIESEPTITVSGGNALDPTAVSLGDGSYRVYYSATSGNDPSSGHFLKSGILRPK
jgi:hypothetical protein